jgi:small-conductance mechanosensitive channel
MKAPDWHSWLAAPLLGNTLRDWLAAAAVFLFVLLAVLLAQRLVLRRSRRRAGSPAAAVSPAAGEAPFPAPSPSGREPDSFVAVQARRTRWLLVLFPALYLGTLGLRLPARGHGLLRSAAIVAVLLQVALWASIAIDYWVARHRRRRLQEDPSAATLIGALNVVLKLGLWAVLVLLALDNLGVNVTTLVAGLGIGGVAVALALQNILGDLFAALAIGLDKPFAIGDTIQVDDLVGTVETVGLKTTRLRSIAGEQLIFANSDLLKSRLHNHRRMSERRAVIAFGVDLETPAERLAEVPPLLRRIVEAQPAIRFERAHFKGIARGSFDFEAVYHVLTPDYAVHMDRQQEIQLELLRGLAAAGIRLADASRTVLAATLAPS